MESKLTYNQKIKTGWKMIEPSLRMRVEIRYDDECKNGHNTFAITATIEEKRGNRFYDYSGGCLHDEIIKHYPEYAHLIKWHLVSSDEPMHYIANTLYHASDKDCYGRRKGEISRYEEVLKFENFPITFKLNNKFRNWIKALEKTDFKDLVIKAVPHIDNKNESYKFKDKYTYKGYAVEWHYCPFDSESEAKEMLEALQNHNFSFLQIPIEYSEGKERNLDAARNSAAWPEATDEELTSSDLKDKLIARLPAMQADFKQAMESLGFTY